MELKKITEVVIVSGVIAVAMSNANAAAISYSAGASSQQLPVTSGTNNYVLEAFKINLSANVAMQWYADVNTAAINTASTRGMHTFGSSTAGVAPRACESSSVSSPTPPAPTNVSLGC